jgi:hypothetical protein
MPYRGYWYGAGVGLRWQIGAPAINPLYGPVGDLSARATWTTPLFDLRPDLAAGSAPDPGASTPIQRKTLLGIEYNLQVQVRTPAATPVSSIIGQLDAMKVYTIEFGGPSRPDDMYATTGDPDPPSTTVRQVPVFFQERVDITASFQMFMRTPGTVPFTTELRWTPPGPMRYWGVALVIDLGDTVAHIPTLNRMFVTASMH